jgi:hypothetical protein
MKYCLGAQQMREVLKLFLLAAITLLSLFNLSFCQQIDSLKLSSVRIEPGDTGLIYLSLCNRSFAVGGITATVIIPDSARAYVVDVQRGTDLVGFAYFSAPVSTGSIRIVSIAKMPGAEPAEPLAHGYHEIAVIRIALADTIESTDSLDIVFDRTGHMINVITDSSGYHSIEPHTADGKIMIDYPFGIDGESIVPSVFELRDNYPNPFNAGTNIEFTLRQPGYVRLDIFDVLGRKVARLFDRYALAGRYIIRWNGMSDRHESLPGGMYFYRIEFDEKSISKKMIMVK